MTDPARSDDPTARTALGRAAVRRWARPTPPGRPRPAPLGSLAGAAVRFSTGLARPPQVRRQLAGPGEIRPAGAQATMRPPRWWVPPAPVQEQEEAPARWSGAPKVAALPARGLRRAAAAIPNEKNYVPGGMANRMGGTTINVRPSPEVRAAGPIGQVGTRLVAPKPAAPVSRSYTGPPGRGSSGAPPGASTGEGSAHQQSAGAFPQPALGTPSGRSGSSPTRPSWLQRVAPLRRRFAAAAEAVAPVRRSPVAGVRPTGASVSSAAPAAPAATGPAATNPAVTNPAVTNPAATSPAAGPAVSRPGVAAAPVVPAGRPSSATAAPTSSTQAAPTPADPTSAAGAPARDASERAEVRRSVLPGAQAAPTAAPAPAGAVTAGGAVAAPSVSRPRPGGLWTAGRVGGAVRRRLAAGLPVGLGSLPAPDPVGTSVQPAVGIRVAATPQVFRPPLLRTEAATRATEPAPTVRRSAVAAAPSSSTTAGPASSGSRTSSAAPATRPLAPSAGSSAAPAHPGSRTSASSMPGGTHDRSSAATPAMGTASPAAPVRRSADPSVTTGGTSVAATIPGPTPADSAAPGAAAPGAAAPGGTAMTAAGWTVPVRRSPLVSPAERTTAPAPVAASPAEQATQPAAAAAQPVTAAPGFATQPAHPVRPWRRGPVVLRSLDHRANRRVPVMSVLGAPAAPLGRLSMIGAGQQIPVGRTPDVARPGGSLPMIHRVVQPGAEASGTAPAPGVADVRRSPMAAAPAGSRPSAAAPVSSAGGAAASLPGGTWGTRGAAVNPVTAGISGHATAAAAPTVSTSLLGPVSIARSHAALRRSTLPVAGSPGADQVHPHSGGTGPMIGRRAAAAHHHGGAATPGALAAFPVASAFALPTREVGFGPLRRSAAAGGSASIRPRATNGPASVRPLIAVAPSAGSAFPPPAMPGAGPAGTVPTSAPRTGAAGTPAVPGSGHTTGGAPGTAAAARPAESAAAIRRTVSTSVTRPPVGAAAGLREPAADRLEVFSAAGVPGAAPPVPAVARRSTAGFTAPSRFAATTLTGASGTPTATPGTPVTRTGAGVPPAGLGPDIAGPAAGAVRRAVVPGTLSLMRRAGVAPPRGTPGRPVIEAGPKVPAAAAGSRPLGTPNSTGPGDTAVRRSSLLDHLPAFQAAQQQVQAPTGAISRLGQTAGPLDTIRRATVMGNGAPVDMSRDMPGADRNNLVTDYFTPDDWDRIVERVMERVEERVGDELARRGRHYEGGML